MLQLVMLKAPYLSMESILASILGYVKTSFSACTLTDLATVHYSSLGCTSVLVSQHPVLLTNHVSQVLRLHSLLEHFQTLTIWMMGISITCQRELSLQCPTLGANLCHCYLNVRALGAAIYK